MRTIKVKDQARCRMMTWSGRRCPYRARSGGLCGLHQKSASGRSEKDKYHKVLKALKTTAQIITSLTALAKLIEICKSIYEGSGMGRLTGWQHDLGANYQLKEPVAQMGSRIQQQLAVVNSGEVIDADELNQLLVDFDRIMAETGGNERSSMSMFADMDRKLRPFLPK